MIMTQQLKYLHKIYSVASVLPVDTVINKKKKKKMVLGLGVSLYNSQTNCSINLRRLYPCYF